MKGKSAMKDTSNEENGLSFSMQMQLGRRRRLGGGNGWWAHMLACRQWLGSMAMADGGGRRWGPTVRADSDGWRDGARWLRAAPGLRGPGGHSEGRGPPRGREPAGMAGGDDQQRGPTTMTE